MDNKPNPKDKADASSSTTTATSFLSSSTTNNSVLSSDPPAYTEAPQPTASASHEVSPWPDSTYIILHRATQQPITVTPDGIVGLNPTPTHSNQGSHFKCVEKDGWIGFKHAGRYLGHDNNKFRADARFHRQKENFCVRRHPDGGYQMRNLHRWTFRNMGVDGDGGRLVVARDGGDLWDFVKVG